MKKENEFLTSIKFDIDKMSSIKQLLFFSIIMLISGVFISAFGMLMISPFFGTDFISDPSLIENCFDSDCLMLKRYLQMISQIGLFIIPVFLFVFISKVTPTCYLSLNFNNLFFPFVFSFFVVIISYPLLSWLLTINQQIELPEIFSLFENKIRNFEQIRIDMSNAFINDKSKNVILVNVFMFGVFPAIGEELIFRGVLIRILSKWSGSVHKAILISSILFCIVHLQFFSFFPRFIMGLILGYSLFLTGSIIVPIVIHFINNILILLIAYFDFEVILNMIINNNYYLFGSIILSLGLFYLLKKISCQRFLIRYNYNKY